jgi:hypothetical protein
VELKAALIYAEVQPFRLSGRTIAYISLRGFTSAFSRTSVAGAGRKHGCCHGEDCDNQNCLSHFPGYFKLIIKAWYQVDLPGYSEERTI